jgi:3-dehydroquinate synthase
METIQVNLGERSYPIHIGQDILGELPGMVERTGVAGTLALVTDSTVAPLYAEQVESLLKDAGHTVIRCVMPAGESNKRLHQVETFIGEFLQGGLDRSSLVIALGGGVVGDTAGYSAAAFMRGIPFIQIPTTIVAQVDSSVGGKTGVNHALGKNIIGAFHQPEGVLIDMTMLRSLAPRELRAGLAEVIKHGVIADESLFAHMEQNVDAILACDLDALIIPVKRSCEIKSAVVAADEKEHGLRANLNYGHTFGHGIEAVTEYKKFLHGEAIALGMCAAGALSQALGLVDTNFVERQRACFEAYELPTRWPDLPVEDVLAAMKHDKKARAGTLKFVVADSMGHVIHRTDITEDQTRDALKQIV